MDRREFLSASAVGALAAVLPQGANAAVPGALAPPPVSAPWRTFELVTEVEIWPQDLPAKLWLPLPGYGDTSFQRAADVRWSGNPSSTGIYRDPRYGAPAFFARWDERASAPKLQVATRFATRNRSVDLKAPGSTQALSPDDQDLYLRPTAHIPNDGIVRSTAARILPMSSGSPTDRARAIFEWVVLNTYRNPKTIGCGTGDIRFMLESDDLGGKCADLNALLLALRAPLESPRAMCMACASANRQLGRVWERAVTSPRPSIAARNTSTPPSDGFRSTRRTCVKSCSKKKKDRLLPLDDPRVELARKTLFGYREMNWVGFNAAGDTRLAPETTKPLGHFMYPYAEGAKGPLDYYDPQNFQYRMSSREVSSYVGTN